MTQGILEFPIEILGSSPRMTKKVKLGDDKESQVEGGDEIT